MLSAEVRPLMVKAGRGHGDLFMIHRVGDSQDPMLAKIAKRMDRSFQLHRHGCHNRACTVICCIEVGAPLSRWLGWPSRSGHRHAWLRRAGLAPLHRLMALLAPCHRIEPLPEHLFYEMAVFSSCEFVAMAGHVLR